MLGTEASEKFLSRHIGLIPEAQQAMLSELGYVSSEELISQAVPSDIRSSTHDAFGSRLLPAASEAQALRELRALAAKNRVTHSLIGQGYYGTIVPSVIARNVFENPSWYTAYTPYQPEVSQGRLEALLNFQTMVNDLSGLDFANSSMLDEATAVVEAMLLARRAHKGSAQNFIVDSELLPQSKAVLGHRAEAVGITTLERDLQTLGAADLENVFALVVQYPAHSGLAWDPTELVKLAKEQGVLVIFSADLLALTILQSPGELGADIAVGTTQRFGVPMGFGGPHAGFMSVRKGLERQLPGRLVGVSVDAQGSLAYRLTLQAREQHIRREKATSNICTAQVLLAVMASMYAVYHGPSGLKRIAQSVHTAARVFADSVRDLGIELVHENFFDTVQIRVPSRAEEFYEVLRKNNFTPLLLDGDTLSFAFDEVFAEDELLQRQLFTVMALLRNRIENAQEFGAQQSDTASAPYGTRLPETLLRRSDILKNQVFRTHTSETRMMRYLKYLSDLDYALDRGMIPLGSCTMKLNAATEMAAVSWPEFANIHPFAPREDTEGYLELITQLQEWLAELTGYDTVSVQPNAGSQGELAGLLAIRNYHHSRGEIQRTICLIPSSAHGTNAASAVLAGMRVIVTACDESGNVDLADLREKIVAAGDELAALMITYPSTHGVYEPDVREICQAVHDAGGQVYIDGANLNALLGLAKFGEFGGDVSHLNLHKTFAIPHGGGGPGVGPVAAKAHLAEFLPGHPSAQKTFHAGGPLSAAPYGSASILPISWAYIRMLGSDGLKQATEAAVLSANYIAKRLGDLYPVLYTGDGGLVAHECILDLRQLTEQSGVTAEDVAKRLIDYGFHAPTMSFPVAGTLMVEPTESEDFIELERFISAMRAIHAEIGDIIAGKLRVEDSMLRNSPHTAHELVGDWSQSYTREQAVYPSDLAWRSFAVGDRGFLDAASRQARIRGKYWPPVKRIDNAYGDRNLVCACPPPEAFE
ncbi:MAG: aminomethyl-transferring glycine dehydrogenase [Microbacteriaceae bacterium]